MTAATDHDLLKWLLRLSGGIELFAIPFIVCPLSGMNAIHDRLLGLGPLPPGPVVEYMARTLSAVYAAHGTVLVALSFDVARYRPVILTVGLVHTLAGIAFLGSTSRPGCPGSGRRARGRPSL